MRCVGSIAAACAAVLGLSGIVSAQAVDSASTFRVFLKAGEPLPGYGEAAVVGDRVIFTLLIGGEGSRTRVYQLVNLPVHAVDLERTVAYARSVRAAYYAATRGEADYAEMAADVSSALDALPGIQDPEARLRAALEARDRMMAWSERSYGYRTADTGALAALFDVILGELRAAAGVAQIEVTLSARVMSGSPEPLQPLPGMAESVRLALSAASAADEGAERLAILRGAEAVLAEEADLDGLAALIRERIATETTAEERYQTLADRLLGDADRAIERGDPAAVARLRADLEARDRELGGLRPRVVRDLTRLLDVKAVAARAHRAALDRYAEMRPALLDYERRIRPALVAMDGLRPVLEAVRDMRFTAFDRLRTAHARIDGALSVLGTVSPPADLADVHATLGSAAHLLREAMARRLTAAATGTAGPTRDAAAAAAGAEMLLGRARADLVARLFPPKPRS